MAGTDKTDPQLLAELNALRGRITELEALQSEKAAVEQALRESEDRYRRMIQAVTDYVFTVRIEDGRPLGTVHGPACVAVTGYSPDEFRDDPYLWIRMVHQEDVEAVRQLTAQVLSGASPVPLEHRIWRKDGVLRWVSNALVPRFDGRGRLLSYDGLVSDITERRLVQQALEESERRFRALIEHASETITIVDSQGICRYEGPSTQRILGYAPGELVGRDAFWLVHPEDLPTVRASFLDGLRQPRAVQRAEYRARHKDGSWRVIDAVGCNLLDEPAIRGLVIHARDITPRRNAEEALRRSEERFRQVAENALEWIWEVDPSGLYTYASPAVHRILGYTPEELVGRKHFQDLFHPDDREELTGVTFQSFALRKTFRELVNRCICKDGTEVWLSTSAMPVVGPDGDLVGYRGIDADVTERKRAEDALRESEERLRLALAGADLGTWDWHIPSGVMKYNERWASMFGYALDELGSDVTAWKRMLHPDEAPRLMETLSMRLEGRTENYEAEHRLRHKSGHWVWVLSRGSVIEHDAQGKGIRICGTVLDITARKMAETARNNLEAQLTQAQKMESVGRLAGGVAHDFNNLLTAILGYTELELASAESLDPHVVESFLEIRKAGERARDLTRQLLAFGRKQTLEIRVLDLNEVVNNLGKMLGRLIGEDVRVRTILDTSIGRVKADASQIEQVLLNLAVNARDAMPGGGVLTIETSNVRLDEAYAAFHSQVPPGEYVVLSVGDTGCGMDAETLKMAFEPFFTTKGPGQGTGLGLATVYGIVKQHDGHIVVHSEPGVGTAIKIYVPRVDDIAQPSFAPAARARPVGGTATVLVVEDDAAVRRLTASVLADLGYDVLEADSGRTALLLAAKREKIELLVTDVIMPEMSGREVYEQLRVRYPHMRALYVSGYTANIIAQHGILDEGVHLLQKPFSVEALAGKVYEVLSC